jgi:hypothetical protein
MGIDFETLKLPCHFDLKDLSYFNDSDDEQDIIKFICSIRNSDYNDVICSIRGYSSDGEMGCDAACYIEDIDFPEHLIDCEIIEMEKIYKDEYVIDSFYGDHIQPWAIKIKTNKGYCTIDMRLEHNGYYAGELFIERLENIPIDMIDISDWAKYKGR